MTPYIAVGNDELGEPLGDTIKCPRCGQDHSIEQSGPSRVYDHDTRTWTQGEPGLLQFYKCGDATYLAGIGGNEVK